MNVSTHVFMYSLLTCSLWPYRKTRPASPGRDLWPDVQVHHCHLESSRQRWRLSHSRLHCGEDWEGWWPLWEGDPKPGAWLLFCSNWSKRKHGVPVQSSSWECCWSQWTISQHTTNESCWSSWYVPLLKMVRVYVFIYNVKFINSLWIVHWPLICFLFIFRKTKCHSSHTCAVRTLCKEGGGDPNSRLHLWFSISQSYLAEEQWGCYQRTNQKDCSSAQEEEEDKGSCSEKSQITPD